MKNQLNLKIIEKNEKNLPSLLTTKLALEWGNKKPLASAVV